MIDIKVKPSTGNEMMGGDFEPIKDGIYDVVLDKFGEWTQGTDRRGVPYYRVNFTLAIDGGAYNGRLIFDNLFINEKTPEWVLGNFLASFTDADKEMNASEFETLVGNKGKISTKTETYTKKVTDPDTGIEEEVEEKTAKVKNFLLKDEDKSAPWPK